MNTIKIIYIYFIIVNLLSFVLYGIDKFKAKANSYRIPEKILLSFTLLGGFLGSTISMIFFKHKLSKKPFILTAILSSIIYLAILGYFIFN